MHIPPIKVLDVPLLKGLTGHLLLQDLSVVIIDLKLLSASGLFQPNKKKSLKNKNKNKKSHKFFTLCHTIIFIGSTHDLGHCYLQFDNMSIIS